MQAVTEMPRATWAVSDAYAVGEISRTEYEAARRVAKLEDAIRLPFCQTVWANVQAGDAVLISRHGKVVKVRVQSVEKHDHAMLIDYTVGDFSCEGVFFPPSETAFIQQR